MAGRLTQDTVESLNTGTPTGRLTQEAVESLGTGTPTGRLTQDAVEVLVAINQYLYDGSGGLVFSPSIAASSSVQYSYSASGNLLLSGIATADITAFIYDTIGNLRVGSSSPITTSLPFQSSGEIAIGNSATYTLTQSYDCSGNIVIGNIGIVLLSYDYAGSGSIQLNNNADIDIILTVIGNGYIVTSNSTSYYQTITYTSNGYIALNNSATATSVINHVATITEKIPPQQMGICHSGNVISKEAFLSLLDPAASFRTDITSPHVESWEVICFDQIKKSAFISIVGIDGQITYIEYVIDNQILEKDESTTLDIHYGPQPASTISDTISQETLLSILVKDSKLYTELTTIDPQTWRVTKFDTQSATVQIDKPTGQIQISINFGQPSTKTTTIKVANPIVYKAISSSNVKPTVSQQVVLNSAIGPLKNNLVALSADTWRVISFSREDKTAEIEINNPSSGKVRFTVSLA